MEKSANQEHWDKMYTTKQSDQVSWYQRSPETSLRFLENFHLPKSAKIIDVGGGDSFLVDKLLEQGFEDITVLDISEKVLDKVKARLGDKACKVKWIVADASQFHPSENYDCWHDRAAFHFLTEEKDIESYLENIRRFIAPGGYLVLGTFSEKGPEKCSGLPVHRYSAKEMTARLKGFFKKIKCITVEHFTPFGTVQEFVFCSFRRVGVV